MTLLLISIVLLLTNLALALWVYNTSQELKRLRKQAYKDRVDIQTLRIQMGRLIYG